MTSQFVPRDMDARRKVSEQLEETLFVEASAGTGKTTSLVQRVVNLVASGRATIGSIAAITFTEAAAAELRDRARQELEQAAHDQARSEPEQARCRRAVDGLGQAYFQTLHSFASALLHERPLEAGLPPGFETTDAIAAELRFDAAWNDWLGRQLEGDTAIAEPLSIALSSGMTVAHLRAIAMAFHQNYSDLRGVEFENLPCPQATSKELLASALPEMERLSRFSNLGSEDLLYRHVQEKLNAICGLEGLDPGSSISFMLLNRLLPLKQSRGRQGDWEHDPSSGRNACAALKDLLSELDEQVSHELRTARQVALISILRELQKFVLDYAGTRREIDGRAEFHDLLVWTHELLRDNIEVRDHFRRRFTHLLIDESQDTDPIQAEIAMFLAEAVEANVEPDHRPRAWNEITPERGKLFVVGDPKQSIYRFRRADVNQMYELRNRMGGESVELTQNFRSQEPVTAWVNFLFAKWLGEGDADAEGHIQASYPGSGMEARWQADTSHQYKPRVWALADEVTDAGMDSVREVESEDIARLLHHIVRSPWQVLDQGADNDEIETYRSASYADICILMPRRTGLRQLELALEDAGVPYRLESASLVFETQEILDLMNCLKAIDNPSDQVATVAALRSPAFGCSDVELFLHHENGGSFNYRAKQERHGPVADALDVLNDYHRRRVEDSPGLLIDRFIRERLLMEASVSHPRMREQWRRYRFMVDQARLFSEAAEPGRNSLRSFIEWLQNQMDEDARVTETPVPEEDEEAVRVMTIHGAKGLEFPVVVLTGINSPPRQTAAPVLFDRNNQRVEVGVGSQQNRIATPGYSEMLDRETLVQNAEQVRLMYVATTRARDHLVLSLRRTDTRSKGAAAAKISELLKDNPILWDAAPVEPPEALPPPQDSPAVAAHVDHSLEGRQQWKEQRKILLEEMGRPSFVAATALDHKDTDGSLVPDVAGEAEQESAEPWRRGRAGTLIGRALHVVLQSADLETGSDIEVWAKAQSIAEGIPGSENEITQLARRAIESPTVRRAVRSGYYWREVPVAIPVGEGSIQGFIDLLFEEEGELVVVDYKTDDVREEAETALDRYTMQGAAYALALQRATGKTVKEVIFLFPRPEPVIEVPLTNLAALTAQAQALALERLGTTAG